MKQQRQQQRNELISIVTTIMLVLPLLTFSFSLQTQRADATIGTGGNGGNVVAGAQQTLIVMAPPAVTGENVWVEIDSDADSVVVTWWETNQTSDTPVMRVSTDNGATFGPTLRLGANGTIGAAEEEEE